MDIVSNKTAHILKNEGFPQPEMSVGQCWYGLSEKPFIVVSGPELWDGTMHLKTVSIGYFGQVHHSDPALTIKHCAFAPTAVDILALLHGYVMTKPGGKFCCYKTAIFGGKETDHNVCSDVSAAEACAKKWIELHSKK